MRNFGRDGWKGKTLSVECNGFMVNTMLVGCPWCTVANRKSLQGRRGYRAGSPLPSMEVIASSTVHGSSGDGKPLSNHHLFNMLHLGTFRFARNDLKKRINNSFKILAIWTQSTMAHQYCFWTAVVTSVLLLIDKGLFVIYCRGSSEDFSPWLSNFAWPSPEL